MVARLVNTPLRRLFGLEIRRPIVPPPPPEPVVISSGQLWDYGRFEDYWIGGRLVVGNTSGGYHALLRQWWEHYNTGLACLLVTESNTVKAEFEALYPGWTFATLDLFGTQGGSVDITADLCADDLPSTVTARFDLVICQATLEHIYGPFAAMRNMTGLLKAGGVLVVHTHTPEHPYHACPRDYFRFQTDWFEDLPKHISGTRLLELYAIHGQVFAAYVKEGGTARP